MQSERSINLIKFGDDDGLAERWADSDDGGSVKWGGGASGTDSATSVSAKRLKKRKSSSSAGLNWGDDSDDGDEDGSWANAERIRWDSNYDDRGDDNEVCEQFQLSFAICYRKNLFVLLWDKDGVWPGVGCVGSSTVRISQYHHVFFLVERVLVSVC